jgi:hypothetical protein
MMCFNVLDLESLRAPLKLVVQPIGHQNGCYGLRDREIDNGIDLACVAHGIGKRGALKATEELSDVRRHVCVGCSVELDQIAENLGKLCQICQGFCVKIVPRSKLNRNEIGLELEGCTAYERGLHTLPRLHKQGQRGNADRSAAEGDGENACANVIAEKKATNVLKLSESNNEEGLWPSWPALHCCVGLGLCHRERAKLPCNAEGGVLCHVLHEFTMQHLRRLRNIDAKTEISYDNSARNNRDVLEHQTCRHVRKKDIIMGEAVNCSGKCRIFCRP